MVTEAMFSFQTALIYTLSFPDKVYDTLNIPLNDCQTNLKLDPKIAYRQRSYFKDDLNAFTFNMRDTKPWIYPNNNNNNDNNNNNNNNNNNTDNNNNNNNNNDNNNGDNDNDMIIITIINNNNK